MTSHPQVLPKSSRELFLILYEIKNDTWLSSARNENHILISNKCINEFMSLWIFWSKKFFYTFLDFVSWKYEQYRHFDVNLYGNFYLCFFRVKILVTNLDFWFYVKTYLRLIYWIKIFKDWKNEKRIKILKWNFENENNEWIS